MAWEYISTAAIIFLAGVIKGYSGFGFAMICAIGLSFMFPPAQVTPIILCLDTLPSIWLVYKVRKEVEWSGLKYIGLGALFALPLGSLALVIAPVNPMRIFISMVIISLCFGLLKNKKQHQATGKKATVGVGLVSGFLNGVAAIGGPPVILFYFSSNQAVAVSRASMIAFFLMMDTLTLASSACYGLLTHEVLVLSASVFIPLMAGIWLGNFFFGKYAKNEAVFRKQVIIFLMGIASVSLVKFSFIS